MLTLYEVLTHHPTRVLIATIRDKGKHPCPRCNVAKEDIAQLGWQIDARTRENKARHDNDEYRWKVDTARDIIYNRHFTVNSEAVETILKEESLVPTKVNIYTNPHRQPFSCVAERLFYPFVSLRIRFLPNAACRLPSRSRTRSTQDDLRAAQSHGRHNGG